MWMPDNPADIPTWVQETLAIAQHSIYVSDRGKVYCSDPMCQCDGENIAYAMLGRRHVVECLIAAIARHRRDNVAAIPVIGKSATMVPCLHCTQAK